MRRPLYEKIVFAVCVCLILLTLGNKSRVYNTTHPADRLAEVYLPMGNEPEEIVVHFHERRPYYLAYKDGVHGLVADPVNLAFEYADIPFVWRQTPAKRQLNIIEQNTDKSCAAGWFKTAERQKYAVFSSPVYEDKPFVAVTRADNHLLSENMALEEVFEQDRLLLLVKSGYSYGNYIDSLLEKHTPRMAYTTAENRSMLEMIQKHRADYCLMAEEEASDLLLFSGVKNTDFKLVHFSDTPAGNTRHLICTQMVSQDTMNKLNQAINYLTEFKK